MTTFLQAASPYGDDADRLATAMHDALKAELQRDVYSGLTRQQAWDLLHLPQTTVTTVTQPVPMTLEAVMGAIGTGLAAVLELPSFTDLRDKVQNQDRQGIGLYATALQIAGKIDDTQKAAVLAIVSATEDVQVETVHDARICRAFIGVTAMPNVIADTDFDAAWAEIGGAI